jgi:hypothetical protein
MRWGHLVWNGTSFHEVGGMVILKGIIIKQVLWRLGKSSLTKAYRSILRVGYRLIIPSFHIKFIKDNIHILFRHDLLILSILRILINNVNLQQAFKFLK